MLYQNIVLSGGSTLFKGFGDRLLQEIKKNVAKDMKIRVSIQKPVGVPEKLNSLLSDCSTTRAIVLNLDGRLDPRFSRYIQENVDIEARV